MNNGRKHRLKKVAWQLPDLNSAARVVCAVRLKDIAGKWLDLAMHLCFPDRAAVDASK